jgi:NAD(P)-dependent dehydrogenase (short-subunit alcohol dehydrogenase family)
MIESHGKPDGGHRFDLSGRVCLVTGGNSGIGLGMVGGLGQAGAKIGIWGTNETKNAEAADRLREQGIEVQAAQVDVGDEAQVVAGMAALVERFGRLDACFANAAVMGAWGNPPFLESTLESWRRTMRVNLDGTYLTLREAARQMVTQGSGGSLVATSSIATLFGAPREEAYAASKAGIEALMKSLAVELARYRIRANTLLPGWTSSPQTEAWEARPEAQRIVDRIPLRRWGRPDEWGGIAVYLASDASSWHNGDTFRLDGGYGVF